VLRFCRPVWPKAMDEKYPTIGITMGDPCGIGPEGVVKALADASLRAQARFVVFGFSELISYAADMAELDFPWYRDHHEDLRRYPYKVTVLDYDELRRVVGLSRQCTDLWEEVLGIASHVPSPLTFFDGTIQMGPAVVLRGEQQAVDYYNLLLAELKQRIEDGVAAVDNERFRLYWEGMPIWGKLRELSTQFAQLNTCVLASTYCSSWVFPRRQQATKEIIADRLYLPRILVRCRHSDGDRDLCRHSISWVSLEGVPVLLFTGSFLPGDRSLSFQLGAEISQGDNCIDSRIRGACWRQYPCSPHPW